MLSQPIPRFPARRRQDTTYTWISDGECYAKVRERDRGQRVPNATLARLSVSPHSSFMFISVLYRINNKSIPLWYVLKPSALRDVRNDIFLQRRANKGPYDIVSSPLARLSPRRLGSTFLQVTSSLSHRKSSPTEHRHQKCDPHAGREAHFRNKLKQVPPHAASTIGKNSKS